LKPIKSFCADSWRIFFRDLLSEYEIPEEYPPGVGAEAFDWLQDSVKIFAEYVQDTSCYLVNHIHMAIVLPGGILLDTKY
jgi:hypothetical protein